MGPIVSLGSLSGLSISNRTANQNTDSWTIYSINDHFNIYKMGTGDLFTIKNNGQVSVGSNIEILQSGSFLGCTNYDNGLSFKIGSSDTKK